MTSTLPAQAVAGLLRAIGDRLTIPPAPMDSTMHRLALRSANNDVRLAVGAILGHGLDVAEVEAFTRLLGSPEQAGHGENHVDNAGHVVSAISPGDCISCGGHVGADGVFHAAQVSA